MPSGASEHGPGETDASCPLCLERSLAGGSRVGDDVANVLHASQVHEHALKAEAKTGMGNTAVASELVVPPVRCALHSSSLKLRLEDIEALFSLASADDFSQSRNEEVGRSDGLPVIAEAHVEGFLVGGVVRNEHWALDVLFSEEAFVLGLHGFPPFRGEFEVLTALAADRHRIGVAHSYKGLRNGGSDIVDDSLVDPPIEELHVFAAGGMDLLGNAANKVFRQVHEVVEVCEGNLGLDHPELGSVSSGVGVLGSEGWSECVDVGVAGREGLDIELTRDGEEGIASEEGLPLQVGDTEELSGTFAVACSDDWGVNPEETVTLEEVVYGHRERISNSKHGAKGARPRAEVGFFPEELEAVSLRLERIIFGAVTDQNELVDNHLPALALALAGHQPTRHADRGPLVDRLRDFWTRSLALGRKDEL